MLNWYIFFIFFANIYSLKILKVHLTWQSCYLCMLQEDDNNISASVWTKMVIKHLKKNGFDWFWLVCYWSYNLLNTALFQSKMNISYDDKLKGAKTPCITKPTKSRIVQFWAMAKNRWSGSAWVIFRFLVCSERAILPLHNPDVLKHQTHY